jgi:hypothetical protein
MRRGDVARTFGSGSRVLRAAAGWGLIVVVGFVGAYGVWTINRCREIYNSLKDGGRGWTQRVFRPDAVLGLAPVPDAAGGELLPLGAPVPTRFDHDGFRIPETRLGADRPRPLVLALGCSFTYGAACPAESAYPFVVAQTLGGTALNAGAPGYGLAQMLILARREIPRRAPDHVLVQYADWLVTRAQAGFVPSFYGVLPTPFFVAEGAGLKLQPPVFRTWGLDLPLARFRTTPRGVSDFAAFSLEAGLPLLVHDDAAVTLVEAKRKLGMLPDRAADGEAIVQAVYSEIGALCDSSGARMLIVLLGPPPSTRRLDELRKHGTVVDAELALCRAVDTECPYRFPLVSGAYRMAYGHFRGSPPVFVDPHPNPRAHAVIAAEVVKAIRHEAPSAVGS